MHPIPQSNTYTPLEYTHLLRCMDMYETDDGAQLVFEEAPGGTLQDRINEAAAFKYALVW